MSAKPTPEALLRELRQVVVPAEDSEVARQRRSRVVAELRTKQAKIQVTREIRRVWRRRVLVAAACLGLSACAWMVGSRRSQETPTPKARGAEAQAPTPR